MAEIYNASGRITIDASQALASFDRVEQGARNVDTSLINTGNSTNSFNNNLNNSSGRLSSFGDKAMSIGKKMSLGITTPLTLLGKKAISVGTGFEQQMANVSAISGATGKDFDLLKAKAEEMGAKTKFSASDSAEALSYMAMAGWKTGDMLSGIQPILNLAIASNEDLGSVSDIVTDDLTAFGLSAKDAGMFSDVLASASSNANTNVGMMGETFKYVGSVAGSLGYTVQDTALATGLLANAGIKGSMAGTQLRAGLTNLVHPTNQMQQAMQKYGISITDNHGKMLTFKQVIEELRQKLGGLNKSTQSAVAATIFGKESMSGWLSIINASDKDFNKLANAIDNSSGATQKMADITSKTTQGSILEMKSALEEAGIKIFEALAPSITRVANLVARMANAFSNMNPIVQKFILAITGITMAIGPALIFIAKFINSIKTIKSAFDTLKNIRNSINLINRFKTVISTSISKVKSFATSVLNVSKNVAKFTVELVKNTASAIKNGAIWVAQKAKLLAYKAAQLAVTTATKAMTVAQRLLNIALSANPIGIVITLLVSLAATFVILYNKCEWFRNGVNKVWSEIKRIFNGFANFFKGSFTRDFTRTFGILGVPLNQFFANTRAIFNMIRGVFNGFITFFRGVFTGNWRQAFQGLRNIAVSIFSGIGGILKAPINAAISAINMAIRGINSISFDVPSWVPGVGGQHFGANISEIPALYDGGIFTQPTLLGGSAIVGDKYKGEGTGNPEAVIPLNILWDKLDNIANRPVIVKINERELITMIAEKDREIDMMKKQLGLA